MAKKKISYNQAIEEIETIISQLENEEVDIDELSIKIKHVSELIGICMNKLRQTESELSGILEKMGEE